MSNNLLSSHAPTSPIVSIIILCYNKVEFTIACIEKLLSVTPANLFELVIVDNNSSDTTRQFLLDLRQKISNPRINLLINNENLGFVGGNNQAAKIAKGKYLVLLNNDTLPQEGWLEALIRVVEQDPAVGAVGAKLVYPDGRLQEAGGIIYNDASGCNYGKFQNPNLPPYNYIREVDYCSGACLLIRADLFRELGGLDTRFAPAYYEDTDICFAFRDLGYKVMYQNEAVVEHFEGATAGTDINSGAKRYQEVNRTKFIEKWHHVLQKQSAPPANRLELTKASERIRGKKVLFAHEIPQMFDRASGALRIYNLARLLKKNGHHVTYVCKNSKIFDGIDLTPYVKALQAMGICVYPLDQFSNPNQAFLELLAIRDYDAAFLPFYYSAQQFIPLVREMSPRTRIVIDSVDVHFLRVARQELLEGYPGSWAGYNTEKNKELEIYRTADAVLTVTEKDREELKKYLPATPVISVSDPHNAVENTPGFDERQDIIFVAGFKHTPNIDATLYFYNDIWPLVLKRLPGLRWYIVGDSPSQQIRDLACDNIIVTGYVPELEPYLHKARVAVAPIRFGAGMKGKIACSLAQGLPAVATSIGSEGMGLKHGEDIMVGNTPDEFADSIVALYTDKTLWCSIAQAGKTVLNSKLGDDVLYPQFSIALKIEDSNVSGDVDYTDPVCAASHISKAYKLLLSGAADLAEINFRQIVCAQPEIRAAVVGLALSQAIQGNLSSAYENMNSVLTGTTSPALHLTYAGIIHDNAKAYGKALEAFLLALTFDRNNKWIVNEAAEFIKKITQFKNVTEIISSCGDIGIDVTCPIIRQADLRIEKNDVKGCYDSLMAACEVAGKIGNYEVLDTINTRIEELKNFEKLYRDAETQFSQRNYDKVISLLNMALNLAQKQNNTVAEQEIVQHVERIRHTTNDRPTTTSRKEKEILNYNDVDNVHDLPGIYHYWSEKFLTPKLQQADINGVNELYLRYMRAACRQQKTLFVSMGAGNCEFEIMLAKRLIDEGCDTFVFECIDINTAMLERGRTLAESTGVVQQFIFSEYDINSWQPKAGCSVMMANHSLHHFAELEMLFDKIVYAIGREGVFITNDMVGRNGHMRWPEALTKVHKIWRTMPDRYKYNHQLKRYEEMYENWDCSKESFEGIRSQDILPLLVKKFNFEFFLAFNSFIGVFIDRGFGHNFDPDNAEDRAFIDRVGEIDEASIASGVLKPTQIIAVMRCGTINESLKYHSIDPIKAIRWPNQ